MTKSKLVFIAMALALVAWVGASAATAQDGPSVTAEPSYVEAPGEYTFEVTGTGYTAASVNLTACDTGNPDDVTSDTFMALCGLGSTATPGGDGTFTGTITTDVGEDGVVLVMTELLPGTDQSASVHIPVGAPDMADGEADDGMDDDMGDDEADDGMDDDMGDDEADDGMDDGMDDDMGDGMDDDMADDMDDDMGDGMDDDMADDMDDDMADDEMLADTGSNTPLLAIVALAVVLAGAMVLGLSRRLRIQ